MSESSEIEVPIIFDRFSLNSTSALMMFIGFIMMLVRSQTKTGLLFLGLLAPTIYHLGVSAYLFTIDVIHPWRSRTWQFQGIRSWLESHFRVSLYPRIYYSNANHPTCY